MTMEQSGTQEAGRLLVTAAQPVTRDGVAGEIKTQFDLTGCRAVEREFGVGRARLWHLSPIWGVVPTVVTSASISPAEAEAEAYAENDLRDELAADADELREWVATDTACGHPGVTPATLALLDALDAEIDPR